MTPLDTPAPQPDTGDDAACFTLSNAMLVLPDRVLEGGLRIEHGRIAGLTRSPGRDMGGAFLLPGLVDIHTDHVEKHVFPRSTVRWDMLNAFLAHDAQVIGSGITTVFDSLPVGAAQHRPERREILADLVAALEEGRALGLFRAEHLLHLRCEVTDPATPALAASVIDRAQIVSVMDHTPGDRQVTDIADWVTGMARDLQITLERSRELTDALLERSAREGGRVRAEVVALARAHGLPMLSHDDASPAHVAMAVAEGVAVSEFPTTRAAAEAARAAGLAIVAGAPNYLRGGSQSGNVAVRELLEAGLVDILASDYVPRALIDAAFAIAADPALPQGLPETVRMVSEAPARAAGLTDRGRLEPGLRADLLHVARTRGRTHLRAAWRAGRRVA
ncbi:alpha-D-ribose 1-methylphosphonate 5-triphosphate diphosphatase [Paroceanicella profunda]|uniref:Alpha-D-ribose 1-methylphosphonate 5-triphosphate diphosphatase n=1 Tax=Paroceanicella profunda TaxID=2579971 RepID=A0A5B8FXF1_9RHOB|nr:alpha-D-ribose 1-methylphosphonate 5-triphosphate diphosphatase [Paroceanicella profunda]QDL91199.1 alpha-D-ribose 1-methylphosphonate 5-triphosphate diphosphatase [Paroceanicella profunda]